MQNFQSQLQNALTHEASFSSVLPREGLLEAPSQAMRRTHSLTNISVPAGPTLHRVTSVKSVTSLAASNHPASSPRAPVKSQRAHTTPRRDLIASMSNNLLAAHQHLQHEYSTARSQSPAPNCGLMADMGHSLEASASYLRREFDASNRLRSGAATPLGASAANSGCNSPGPSAPASPTLKIHRPSTHHHFFPPDHLSHSPLHHDDTPLLNFQSLSLLPQPPPAAPPPAPPPPAVQASEVPSKVGIISSTHAQSSLDTAAEYLKRQFLTRTRYSASPFGDGSVCTTWSAVNPLRLGFFTGVPRPAPTHLPSCDSRHGLIASMGWSIDDAHAFLHSEFYSARNSLSSTFLAHEIHLARHRPSPYTPQPPYSVSPHTPCYYHAPRPSSAPVSSLPRLIGRRSLLTGLGHSYDAPSSFLTHRSASAYC